MEVEYSGEHSITFYTTSLTAAIKKNTWTDFHLIPAVRPSITYPPPNIRLVPIPGTNKRVDVTDYHVGGLTFGPRTGTWEFYIDYGQYSNWINSYDEINAFFHGKELYVTLDDEPTVYYRGMFSISSYVTGSSYSKISIQYDLNYDMIVGLLSNYPIKFIGENNVPYAKDYAVKPGTNYIINLDTGGKELFVNDLAVLTNE